VLGDITRVAQKFEEHGNSLAAAAELIDSSNRRTETVVADRRQALDTLVGGIEGKTDDLDQRLKRFALLLQETLEAAEGRARDIARVIAETSSEGTRAIANQYELVRETSDEERKRTADALNSIYEQATGQTTALFRQTSERFVEIVRQMKEMSADMQREMETTRTELRRGILELPQETADSAAQMRRVIVEQIDALAELNRIVARHSRDAAEPARRQDPRRRDRRRAPRQRPSPRPALRGDRAAAALRRPRRRDGRRPRPHPHRKTSRARAAAAGCPTS